MESPEMCRTCGEPHDASCPDGCGEHVCQCRCEPYETIEERLEWQRTCAELDALEVAELDRMLLL